MTDFDYLRKTPIQMTKNNPQIFTSHCSCGIDSEYIGQSREQGEDKGTSPNHGTMTEDNFSLPDTPDCNKIGIALASILIQLARDTCPSRRSSAFEGTC